MNKSSTSTNTLTPTLITDPMNFPTETVNVLPHLNELRETWRNQDFRFTKEQQEEYDMLMQARKERVRWFYETNRVQVGPKVVKKEEVQEDTED